MMPRKSALRLREPRIKMTRVANPGGHALPNRSLPKRYPTIPKRVRRETARPR